MMKLYVGTYRKYNEGSLAGEWIDLNDFSSAEEFYEHCAELHEDEDDPEFMFQDYESEISGEGTAFYSESGISEKYWEYLDEVPDDEKEAFLTYCNHMGYDIDESIPYDSFQEAYQGDYSSDEEFAQEMAENIGAMPEGHNWPSYCIDWEWAARELMFDYFSDNGHYFRSI